MSLPDNRDSVGGQNGSGLRNAMEVPIDISGMDCFVTVVRHICSQVGRDLTDHVTTDEALKFVMADYFASTDKQRDQVHEYRVATFKKVQELVGKDNPTFEDIVECNQVRQRFWARDGLRLFLAVLYRDDNTSPWNSIFDHTFEAAQSLVDWRLEDYGTIEEALMKTKFGVTSLSNGGEALSLFGNPRIIRIRLASKVNRATWKGGAFTVGSARCFSCNQITRKTMRTRADGTTIVSDSSSGGVEDKIVYYLIAVVRLRNPGEGGDYARLYDIESRNILPTGNQEHMDTFNNKLWSLSHLDHDHMLYYARADDRTINCIRHGLEIGDQNSDHDPMGERQIESLWQKRYVLRSLPEQHTTTAIRTAPAMSVERVPAHIIPHEGDSNTPQTNLQPPTECPTGRFPIPPPPPTGPLTDRGVKRGMNSDDKVGHDDHKRPKLADSAALPRGAAISPSSLTAADAQGVSDNNPLPGESNRATQGNPGPQRNHATRLDMRGPRFQLPSSCQRPPRQIPSLQPSPYPTPSQAYTPATLFPPSPAPAPAPAPAAGRGRKGIKKSSGNRARR